MKQIRLQELTLENFKGVKEFTFSPGGENAQVHGVNGSGKTSLYDGFLWLLFGKDSQGRADFEIKTLKPTGQPMHNLTHAVTAVLDIDGKSMVLRKEYTEKYTKKRGNARPEFTGHETNYFVDGVPTKKAEYESTIRLMVDEEALRMLTNPRYFNESLHWTKRREILLNISGDIADADVIASDKALKKLPDILAGRSMEDHKKVIDGRRKEINRELEKLPVRIDEATKSMPDISEINIIAIGCDIENLKELKAKKETALLTLAAGGRAAELIKALRVIEGQIQESVNAAEDGKRKRIFAINDEIDRIYGDKQQKEREAAEFETVIESGSKKTEAMDKLRAELRAQWIAENGKAFSCDQSDTCPTCGQAMPLDQLENARRDALAEFNEKKAKILADIHSRGTSAKIETMVLRDEVAETENRLTIIKAEILKLTTALTGKYQAIDQIKSEPVALPADLVAEKSALEKEIAALAGGYTGTTKDTITREIQAIDLQMIEDRRLIALVESAGKTKVRISDLEAQEKALAAEFEKLESELFLCETFTRAKVAMLEDRINGKFTMARFKLFSDQINGVLTECCEVMFDGVPYNSLNNARRLQIGLDVINTLAGFYQVACPVWLDNKESVTWIPEINAQVIGLVVDGSAEVLEVRQETKQAKAA